MSEKLTGFVVTPTGLVMHAENHRKLVEQLKRSRGSLATLVPAKPLLADPWKP